MEFLVVEGSDEALHVSAVAPAGPAGSTIVLGAVEPKGERCCHRCSLLVLLLAAAVLWQPHEPLQHVRADLRAPCMLTGMCAAEEVSDVFSWCDGLEPP